MSGNGRLVLLWVLFAVGATGFLAFGQAAIPPEETGKKMYYTVAQSDTGGTIVVIHNAPGGDYRHEFSAAQMGDSKGGGVAGYRKDGDHTISIRHFDGKIEAVEWDRQLVPLLARQPGKESSARRWTDSTGTHTVEADFVDFKDGKVQLKKEDGKAITIPIEKLSEADRDFVKTQNSKSVEADQLSRRAEQESLALLGTCEWAVIEAAQFITDDQGVRETKLMQGQNIHAALPRAVRYFAARDGIKHVIVMGSKAPDISAVKRILGNEKATQVRGVLRFSPAERGNLVDLSQSAEKGSPQALLWYDYGSLSFGTIDGKVRAVLVAFQGDRLPESQRAGKRKEHGSLEKLTVPGNKRIQLDITQLATDRNGDLVSDYPAIRDEASKICETYASRLRSDQDVRDLAREIGSKLKVVTGKSVGVTVRNAEGKALFVGDVKTGDGATFDIVERQATAAGGQSK